MMLVEMFDIELIEKKKKKSIDNREHYTALWKSVNTIIKIRCYIRIRSISVVYNVWRVMYITLVKGAENYFNIYTHMYTG